MEYNAWLSRRKASFSRGESRAGGLREGGDLAERMPAPDISAGGPPAAKMRQALPRSGCDILMRGEDDNEPIGTPAFRNR
jgi:hypothetical protein